MAEEKAVGGGAVSGAVPPSVRRLINEAKQTTASTTGSRPQMPQGHMIGYMHFDITLGKPIWWKGTGWVDATGAAV